MGGGGTAGAGGTGGTAGTTDTLTDMPAPCGPGSQCVPDPPAGWQYIRSLALPFGDGTATPCPGGGAPVTYFKDPGSAACTSCNCPWSGVKCSEPEISCYYGNAVCSGSPSFSFTPPSSSCVQGSPITENVTGSASCQVTKSPQIVSPGTCNPGTPQLKEPGKWHTEVRVCSAPITPATGSCGGECAGEGGGSFAGPLCIQQPGNVACPGEWTMKTLVHADADDTRGCDECTCGAPTTTCGTGSYNVFPGPSCQSAGAVSFQEGVCKSVGDAFGGATPSIKPPIISAGSTSTCFGGFPTGAFTPVGPSTICCAP